MKQKKDTGFLGAPKELFGALKWAYIPIFLCYFAPSFSWMFGMGSGLTTVPASFWLQEGLLLTPPQIEWAIFTISLPWISKVLVGHLVDSISVPYRKLCIMLSGVLMAVGFLLLAGLAGGYSWLHPVMVLFGFDPTIGTGAGLEAGILKAQMSALGRYQFAVYILGYFFVSLSMVCQDVIFDPMSRHIVSRMDEEGRALSEDGYRRKVGIVQTWCRISFNCASIAGMLTAFALISAGFRMDEIFLACLVVPVFTMALAWFITLPCEVAVCAIRFRVVAMALIVIFTAVVTQVMDVPFSREISFAVTFAVIAVLLGILHRQDASPPALKRALLFTMFTLFMMNLAPSAGAGVSWWQREVLGFDRDFEIRLGIVGGILSLGFLVFLYRFALRGHLGWFLLILNFVFLGFGLINIGFWYGIHEWLGGVFGVAPLSMVRIVAWVDTATSSPFVFLYGLVAFVLLAQYADDVGTATWFTVFAMLLNLGYNANNLLTGYLNTIFTVSRGRYENGALVVPGNYAELGAILWTSWISSLVIPTLVIIFFLTPWKKNSEPLAYSAWLRVKTALVG